MCHFCVCYSNIYNLYIYKHETISSRLITYLTCILKYGNSRSINRLFGESAQH